MKAPFPYFGSKTAVADKVWQALGQPRQYIEPFFGSGAVLLNRPNYTPDMTETINDKDGFVANVWRSLKFSPDKTAEWADWPVNHADLSARKMKLVKSEGLLLENLIKDDEWHDPKLAGYWIWAACCWIGSGLTRFSKIPHLTNAGQGVHSKIPHLTNAGKGVHGQIPHLANAGKGVHGQIPHLVNAGSGVHKDAIYIWFNQLAERLRNVRVVCGDWNRVCGGNWQNNMGVCGMFFDPPYGHGDGKRDTKIYHHDSMGIAADVRKWCLERGKIKTYRIVLAGYEGEHNELEADGWTKQHGQSTTGGYANTQRKDNSDAVGKSNAKLERLWMSPHCIKEEGLLL